MKTKEEILKKVMSVKYCGETRFDFLDEEEVALIYKAMEIYSKQFKPKTKKLPKNIRYGFDEDIFPGING
jgi:hypothetical protein